MAGTSASTLSRQLPLHPRTYSRGTNPAQHNYDPAKTTPRDRHHFKFIMYICILRFLLRRGPHKICMQFACTLMSTSAHNNYANIVESLRPSPTLLLHSGCLSLVCVQSLRPKKIRGTPSGRVRVCIFLSEMVSKNRQRSWDKKNIQKYGCSYCCKQVEGKSVSIMRRSEHRRKKNRNNFGRRNKQGSFRAVCKYVEYFYNHILSSEFIDITIQIHTHTFIQQR